MGKKTLKLPAKSEMAFGRIPAYCKYELYMERYRSAAEIIRRQMEISPTTRILDAGPGEGKFRYFFDSDEGQWIGVEYNEKNIEACTRLGYEIVVADLNQTRLPFPDEHFDIVLASHVIEHLSNIDFCLSELDRVLKRGGILLIATPTKPPLIAWLLHRRHQRKNRTLGQTQNAFSAISLRRFVQKRLPGYRLIDSRGLRILSARKRLKLENSYLFYKVNAVLGRYLTTIVPEVNLIYRKNDRAAPETPAPRR